MNHNSLKMLFTTLVIFIINIAYCQYPLSRNVQKVEFHNLKGNSNISTDEVFHKDINIVSGEYIGIPEFEVVNNVKDEPSPAFAWALGDMLTFFWTNYGDKLKDNCHDVAVLKAYNGARVHVGRSNYATQVFTGIVKEMFFAALPPGVKSIVENAADFNTVVKAIIDDDWEEVEETTINWMFKHLNGKLKEAGLEEYADREDDLKELINGYIDEVKEEIKKNGESFTKNKKYGKYEEYMLVDLEILAF